MGWGGVFVCVCVWGMVVCVVCMVAPILKDHLNTNACVSVTVRAKRAEGCLCVCGGGIVVCVVCMVAPILKDHLNTNASASVIAS